MEKLASFFDNAVLLERNETGKQSRVCRFRGFSEHFRYVLPCFPFAFIGISCLAPLLSPAAKKEHGNLLDKNTQTARISGSVVRRVPNLLASIATSILLLWSVASSLWIYPHSLSYFNESIRGPLNGPEHLLGSNVDWGQDVGMCWSIVGDEALAESLTRFV